MNIGICCMMKNESRSITRLVDTFRDVSNHFFFLDTGSTDDTVAEAKKHGVVWESEFNNFVDSKNELLEKVDKISYIDYIMWVDAKEFLFDPDKKQFVMKLKNLIHFGNYDTITTPLIMWDADLTTKGTTLVRVRAWKNHRYNDGVKFKGPYVHEYIDTKSSLYSNIFYTDDIYISHNRVHGDPEMSQNKNDLYIGLLEDAIEKGIEVNRGLFYLARTYMDMRTDDSYKLAISTYEKYFIYCKEHDINFLDELTHALLETGVAHLFLKSYEKAKKIFIQLIDTTEGNRIEPYFYMSKTMIDGYGDYSEARLYLNKAIELIEKDIPQKGIFISDIIKTHFVPNLDKFINHIIKEKSNEENKNKGQDLQIISEGKAINEAYQIYC